MPDRFLTQEQVAEELSVSKAQIYALLRAGDLRGIKLGGRGVWRVARTDLEEYIERTKAETAAWVAEHPYDEQDPDA